MNPPDPGAAPPLRSARSVPADHALAWFRDALALWKRGPATFALLALVTVLADFGLQFIPVVGIAIEQVVLPIIACGLMFASLAADRGEPPRLAHLLLVLGASRSAIVAVVLAGLAVFAAEAATAWLVAGANLLVPSPDDAAMPAEATLAIYAVGIAVSLPFTFVPFAALFDGAGVADAFAQSFEGFARNTGALAIYGLLSLGLLLLGFLTLGLGLLLALPLMAIASYVAWKDIYGVGKK